MEETVVTGRMATVEADQVKRTSEPADAHGEAATKAIQEWLRTVDKPLESKVELITEYEKGDPVQGVLEEDAGNLHAETDGDHFEVPELTPDELVDLLAEIDREYFQDN